MQYTLLYEREPLFSNDDLDLFLADVELDADIRNIPFDEAKTRQLIAGFSAAIRRTCDWLSRHLSDVWAL